MPTSAVGLSYDCPGATEPAQAEWSARPPGFRRFERSVIIGVGDHVWNVTRAEVLRWGVKVRSGFRVSPDLVAVEGTDYAITAGWGPVVVREPVRVVAVIDDDERCGFAYGTKPGHPVCGEEAFIVHRDATGTVFLTLRSLTRPAADGPWRRLFPALLIAQRFFRHRYLKALVV